MKRSRDDRSRTESIGGGFAYAGDLNATATDDRDRIIAELREAVHARDDLLAIAGHELRNPLAPIQLSVQLLRVAQEAADPARIETELIRLERLINQFLKRATILLDVAQITTGKLHLAPTELNLSELARGVVESFAPMLARSGSVITTNIQENVTGLLDEIGVTQVLDNLLSNAIKYGEGKPIEFGLEATEGFARITMRDYGIGIDASQRERIFERFERAVRRSAQPGFGIGLWVTRKLTDAMGGSIAISGQEGAGSLFIVTLPLNGRNVDE